MFSNWGFVYADASGNDRLDAPIDLSRALIQSAPTTFIMVVKGSSAIDASIFDGSFITVERSLVPWIATRSSST